MNAQKPFHFNLLGSMVVLQKQSEIPTFKKTLK